MRRSILLALCTLAAVSCVNEEYDITRPIDMTMNIGGQLEMPVPGESEYSYRLGDIIFPDNEDPDGIVRRQDDGTFLLVIEPTAGLDENYDFPEIDVEDYNKTVLYPTDGYYTSPGPGTSFPDADRDIEISIPFDLTIGGIDSRVEKIGEVGLDADLKITLGATESGVVFDLKDGFTFILPEYMYVDAESLPSYAEIVANPESEKTGLLNTIRINGDRTSENSAFTLECKINKLDVSGFALTETALNDKEISFGSDAFAKGAILLVSSSIPAGTDFRLRAVVDIMGIKATYLTLKSSPLLECDPQEIAIGEVPEIFSDGSLDFKLDDILFYVNADNGTPFDFTVTAGISAYSAWSRKDVQIVGEDGFTVGAGAKNQSFCISESGRYGAATDTKIAVAGLTGLMSPVPDKILLSDIKVLGSMNGEFVTLHASENYNIGLSYRIEAPLSFKSLTLKRDETIDVNLDFGDDAGFDDLYIKADFTSTLPLDANLTFSLADSRGNAVEGVTLKCVDESGKEADVLCLPAGDVSAPSSKVLKLVAAAAEGTRISSLEKLKIHIEASSPKGRIVTLNENQTLAISGITAGTTGGIFVDANGKSSEGDGGKPVK